MSSARCASFSARSENSSSMSSSPPTNTVSASMSRSAASTTDAVSSSSPSLRFPASSMPTPTTSPSALGPACTDSTPSIPSSSRTLASETWPPSTIAAIDAPEGASSSRRSQTCSDSYELGLSRSPSSDENNIPVAAKPAIITSTHDPMTSRGRRSETEARRWSMGRACAAQVSSSSDGWMITRVHPWYDRRCPLRTRRSPRGRDRARRAS